MRFEFQLEKTSRSANIVEMMLLVKSDSKVELRILYHVADAIGKFDLIFFIY